MKDASRSRSRSSSSTGHTVNRTGAHLPNGNVEMEEEVMSGGRPTMLTNGPIDKSHPLLTTQSTTNLKKVTKKWVHPLREWVDRISYNASVQFTKRRSFLFVILFIWSFAVWGGLLYKHISDDWVDIFKYYTNVTLFFQAGFYTIYLFIYIGDPTTRWLERKLLAYLFWIVFSQIILVFFLVLGVLGDAPQLLTKEMKIGGGDYDDGEVFIANWFVHVIPAVIAFIFLTINWTDIADSFVVTFGFFELSENPDRKLSDPIFISTDRFSIYVYTLYQYVLASLMFVLYMLIIDLHEQYEISEQLATWVPILAILFINLLAVCTPIMFMFFSTIAGRYVEYKVVYDCIHSDEYAITTICDGKPRLYVKDMGNLKMFPI
jgi:hypothetical protein